VHLFVSSAMTGFIRPMPCMVMVHTLAAPPNLSFVCQYASVTGTRQVLFLPTRISPSGPLRTNLTSNMRLRSHTRSRRLPPELIEHIIDYLHDNPEDLCSCALVCKAWLAPSRLHLFYKISFHRRPFLPSYRILQCAIQRSSHIALCVRELSFSSEAFHEYLYRAELNTILPQIFRSFTKLRKLTLRSLIWDQMAPDVKKSIQDILAFPSLVHFDTWWVRFSSLESFLGLLHPQLKRLEMHAYFPGNMASEAMDGQETAVKRQPCRLEQLRWYCKRDGFIDWLLGSQSLIDISAVRTLYLREIQNDTQDKVSRLLRTLGASLEHLKLCGTSPNFYMLHMSMRDAPRLVFHGRHRPRLHSESPHIVLGE
jgi:hypothetical protein